MFGDNCVSVLSAAGSAPEEYREDPNEEQYQSTDPQGKQPTIWSYWYILRLELVLVFLEEENVMQQ